MKRFGLVLCGALLCFGWHLGTLSVPPAATTAYNSNIGSGPPRAGVLAQVGTGLHRFALESEQALGRSARALEQHSATPVNQAATANSPSDITGQARQNTQAGREALPPPPETASTDTNPRSDNLAMAWRQVEALFISIQPVAQAGWDGLQSGWHAFTATQAKDGPNAQNRWESQHRHGIRLPQESSAAGR